MLNNRWIDMLQYLIPEDELSPTEEKVTWSIDWGRKDEIACAMIIKNYPDGIREVVAMNYAPYYAWTNLSNSDVETLAKTYTKPETLIIETQRLLKAKNGY